MIIPISFQLSFPYFINLINLVKQYILKEKIKESLGNRQVLAALFHTFNFDPRFFENYVMPLFVPRKNFRDEVIHNKILWRSCLKEGLIPPVAVFCDYFAKDNTEAPSLGYDIYCIKMPAAKGSICNFHPKHIFILLMDDKGEESLLMITGSGNLTPGGWCDNFECFSFIEIKKNKTSPNKSTTNILQDTIIKTSNLANLSKFLLAEELIHDFLRYVDFNKPYFNSLNQSFADFIDENIILKEGIKEVEIVSPYFSNDTKIIEYLKSKGIKKIKCLIPTIRNNEIQLDEETFKRFEKAGIIWSFWGKYNQDGKEYNRNSEVRNQHAKIYRFIGDRKTHTVIGSVNFTNPAWAPYTAKNNKANIESAFLYIEEKDTPLLNAPANLNTDHFRFIPKESLENGEVSAFINRNPPDIEFIIDWKAKTLNVKAKNITEGCYFKNILLEEGVRNGSYFKDLLPVDIKILIKNAMIQVAQPFERELIIHSYYPQQINLEVKPLDFRLDATTILKYWEYIDDEYQHELLTRKMAERATDESGIVDENAIERKLLLNEMAAHFSGLVKLEKHLFPDYIQTKGDRKEKFKAIKYYLLSENIDTLPYYLEDMGNKIAEDKIFKTFYWMTAQIVIVNFNTKAYNWAYRSDIEKDEWRTFRKDILKKTETIKQSAALVAGDFSMTEAKQKWVINQLAEYGG